MDRDSQIKAIETTFEDNKKTIEKHYSKPNVVPVEVLPIFPDFKVKIINCTLFLINEKLTLTIIILVFLSCGNILVLKSSLTLIRLQLVGLFPLKLRKCLKR